MYLMKNLKIIGNTLIIICLTVFSAAHAQGANDGADWYQRALEARQAGEPDAAKEALDAAEASGFSGVRVNLERARLAVEQDDREAAVRHLQEVVDTGFTALGVITGDPLLGGLEGFPVYDELVVELEKAAFPCEHDAAFAAFDFWIGEWDVHAANGNYAGSNVIEKAQRGCVLIENWSSASGGGGMSINYLDKMTDEWVQVWNDAAGNQINIRGGLGDEGMLLVGTIHYVASGTTAPFRGLWTLLDDGRVRQFFEQSNDGGVTWATWFEGFYSRK